MAWWMLLAAGLLEVVWAIALKASDGWSRPWPSALGVVSVVASVVLLSLALKSLPVGTAYAIWVAIGTVGVAIVGILLLGEDAAPLRLGCLGLIVVGAVGLRLLDG